MKRVICVSFLLVFCLVSVASVGSKPAYAQQGPQVDVMYSENYPLASLEAAAIASLQTAPSGDGDYEVPNFYREDTRTQVGAAALGPDPLLLPSIPSAPASLLTTFEGGDNQDNAALIGGLVTPPDTIGDVSSDAVNRYVQMLNLFTTVFDKNGTPIAPGPFLSSTFWAGMGTLCETNDNGDPVVLYDEAANRWMVSQFAFNSGLAVPFLQCVAISQTSNPLGAYNRYAWDFSAIGFNDYPHFGIATNAIGLSVNLFTPPTFAFGGSWLGTIDKACVYAGTGGCVLLGFNLGTSEFGFLPLDRDDPSGAAGFMPAQFGTAMSVNGFFDIWTIVPDFVTPANSTATRTSRIAVAPSDHDLCPATRERCIPHPGTGFLLETLSGRLMHRNQVRSFGTHLSMVASHTVDVAGAPPGGTGRAGIRWYELRSTNGGTTWFLNQQGTHGPADTLHRFMPSVAINRHGDIGLGFMVSDASTVPHIRVAGQTAGSGGNQPYIGAPGVLDVAETTCRTGAFGSDWAGRSGDYSATSVDPTTDTFWHTNEYGQLATLRGWGTYVCEFSLPAPGYYLLDGYGGIHPVGAPPLGALTPYFGFDIARDLELAPVGFYVMDGFGGLHAGGGAPPMVPGPPYFGFDAGADFELAATGFYMLDVFGGIHAGGGAPAPAAPLTPYFGFNVARAIELATPGYYVFDGFGGLHRGGGATALTPVPPYFGFDASQDIELTATGLYALDSFGGVHAVGGAPGVTAPTPYFGFNVARDMELAGPGFYVLDGFGGVHAGNGATPVPSPIYFGFDIASDFEIR